MDFLPSNINDYCEKYTEQEDAVLHELHRATFQKILRPRMLSGHLQGQLLTMLSKMFQPKNILEIGTYTGYSAICLARGLKSEGSLITIDINEELEEFANSFFEKAGLSEQITMKIGNALEIIPTLEMDFDLVFMDADKESYIAYYQMLVPRLKSGSIILIDNVLWSGKVVEPIQEKDIETRTLVELAQIIQDDDRVENILLPIRDGLFLVRIK